MLFLLSKLIWRWQFVLRYGKHDVKIRLYLKIDTSVEILYALWIWTDIQTHTHMCKTVYAINYANELKETYALADCHSMVIILS